MIGKTHFYPGELVRVDWNQWYKSIPLDKRYLYNFILPGAGDWVRVHNYAYGMVITELTCGKVVVHEKYVLAHDPTGRQRETTQR